MSRRPLEAWIWIEAPGTPGRWYAGAMSPDGVYFEERPPDTVEKGVRVIAVQREPGEEPPGEMETLAILADARMMESALHGQFDPDAN
jgi:hypothetical protein